MDLSKLTEKLKEIPFENWKREKPTSWIKYETLIDKHKIQLEILPPKKPVDCTIYQMNIYSPQHKLIARGLKNNYIDQIASNLEEIYKL